jgi:cytochrome c peroxidase
VINAAYQSVLFWDGRARSATLRSDHAGGRPKHAQVENLVIEPFVSPVEMGHAGRTWSDVVARVQAVRPLAIATGVPAVLAAFVGSNT